MKKKQFYLLLACTILSLNACGQKQSTETNEVQIEPAENTVSETETTIDADTESAQETLPESDPGKADYGISIEMVKTEDKATAEDGTVLLIKTCSYPVVSIEGNEEAANKINASIQNILQNFSANADTTLEYAEESYQMQAEEGISFLLEYSEDLTFTAARCDSNVISFRAAFYNYSGGAHGNTTSYTVNYATSSGEEISFADLSNDLEQFHADTLAYNQKLAASESYAERLYSPQMATAEELEPVLYEDHSWYLSASGLIFISDPYLLGAYAGGTIEFLIPYADLTQMGLKEEYAYHGNFLVELLDGTSYTADINGDGVEDNICFSTESICDEENNYVTCPHLFINGTDLLEGNNRELADTFRSYAWGGYALYDLDATDDTLELVFHSYENIDGEYDTYSHLYRYGKDASLTYLGKVRGKVSNPLSDIQPLLP